MSALTFAQYLFDTLVTKVRNNDTGRNRNNVVIYSNDSHLINGTAVDIGIIFSTRNNATNIVFEILNKDVILGLSNTDPNSCFDECIPVKHLRDLYTISDFSIELTVDTILQCKSVIMSKLHELVDKYDDINRNYTVVAKELMLKTKYQQLILNSTSDDVCYICYDKLLEHEKLSCGHHIHSACLSNFIKNCDPEAPYRDEGSDCTSFKCGYCNHWTAAASWY